MSSWNEYGNERNERNEKQLRLVHVDADGLFTRVDIVHADLGGVRIGAVAARICREPLMIAGRAGADHGIRPFDVFQVGTGVVRLGGVARDGRDPFELVAGTAFFPAGRIGYNGVVVRHIRVIPDTCGI